jgi:glycosyltransferase involved in cell wall biosynthesis
MTARRHVMMTTDAVGGVWVYALALSRRLAEAGHRVTLVTLGPPPQGPKCDAARALPSGVALIVTSLSLEWLDPQGDDTLRARSELLRLADRLRPDLVHINGYREGAFPWPCPALVVAHSCVLSWWHAMRRESPPEPRWTAYADAVRAGLNAAEAWVAPTAAFRHSIERLYEPEKFGRVIPNGIDFPETRAISKEPLILASGRIWDSGKNLTGLADMAAQLPWPVHIAGPGMANSAMPSRNIHWLGEVAHSELQRHMHRAAIYAAPAHYEPFGLGILEAARAGCALLLADIASLRELWDGAAVHIPPDDPEHLRNALEALCMDKRSRRRLQYAAAMRAREYTLARTVSSYLALYESLLAPAILQRRPFAARLGMGK